jgi:hypothetical protein
MSLVDIDKSEAFKDILPYLLSSEGIAKYIGQLQF